MCHSLSISAFFGTALFARDLLGKSPLETAAALFFVFPRKEKISCPEGFSLDKFKQFSFAFSLFSRYLLVFVICVCFSVFASDALVDA